MQPILPRHSNQKRKNIVKSPYINHPIHVAFLISDTLNIVALCGALLHDTVEDTQTTLDEIRNIFDEQIADVVDKFSNLKFMILKRLVNENI